MKNEQLVKIKEEFYDQDQRYPNYKLILTQLTDGLNEQVRKVEEVQREIDRINEFLKKDTGPSHRFAYMIDQKYEITKDQYTYSVLPFDRASQSHTSVGTWKEFSSDYSKMLFDRGQNCWGGPDRSLEVTLLCGDTTKILDVREESKCTYLMSMETPGACNDNDIKSLEASLV